MEFQDPTVTCCGEPEAKSDRHGDRGQSRVARHSANNPGFRHTPVGGGNCCGRSDLPLRRHRHDDHRALDCDGGYHGGRDHNRSGSMNQHPKPSAPWLTPLAGATLPATCPALSIVLETREGLEATTRRCADWLCATGFVRVTRQHLIGPTLMVFGCKPGRSPDEPWSSHSDFQTTQE